MSLQLTAKDKSFMLHPEGIHPAVCVDVIDLGLQQQTFQNETKMVPKIKIVWESEQKTPEGVHCTVSKNFTASLHPKAKLNDLLSKWRGKPIENGENIDLQKLINANCTLVISHQKNMTGRDYASIDAISKATKKLKPSGDYDGSAMRQRLAEWAAKQPGAPAPVSAPAKSKPAKPVDDDDVPFGNEVDPDVGF